MAKWFNADVLVNQKYRIAIRNLPPETDEPALIRMLTARGMKNSDVSCVQKFDDSNSSMLPDTKKNFKRKLSYKLSFKSEVQMIQAIEMLKSTKDHGDSLVFDVSAIIAADESPSVVSKVQDLEGFSTPVSN